MATLEQAVEAIEHGLLKAEQEGKTSLRKMNLSQRMASHRVPGLSAALVERGALAWAKGYGGMEAGTDRTVTAETIFQAASISKPVTALIALHLVETGQLDLDAPASDYLRSWMLPESKYTRAPYPPVTLRGLLSHTAGVNIHGYPGYPAGAPLPCLQQVLNGQPPAISKPVRVTQAPGAEFAYSSGGYLAVQQMLEDVTCQPLAALAQEIVFEPLGMTSSTFEVSLPAAWVSRAASAHDSRGIPLPGKWHNYPEQAAASLWSTPSDLARLLVEVLNACSGGPGRVVSPKMARQMLVPQLGIGGLGFNVLFRDSMTRFGHPGWNAGFHCIFMACPETGQGVALMTNGENGRRLRREVMRGLAEVFPWAWW